MIIKKDVLIYDYRMILQHLSPDKIQKLEI